MLLTLPAALVARLPIARVRGGCISCSFRSHPSGCRQALQVGGAARAAVGQAQPHVLLLGRLARLAVELRLAPATMLRPGRARWCRDERRRGDGHRWVQKTWRHFSTKKSKKSSTIALHGHGRGFCTERSYFRSIERLDKILLGNALTGASCGATPLRQSSALKRTESIPCRSETSTAASSRWAPTIQPVCRTFASAQSESLRSGDT